MSKIVYYKLVRDRIPDIIEAKGHTCETKRLRTNAEYIETLDAKLKEEVEEYRQDKNLEELADILEVLYAVTKARGYTLEELEQARRDKAERCGSFDQRIYLEAVIEK